MKTLAISQFKARALKIIDQIARSQESLVITKRGQPVAEVIPFRHSKEDPKPGKLASTLVFEEDIISPLGESMWEACS